MRVAECDVLTVDPIKFYDALPDMPDTVVSVVGLLGEQHRGEIDPAHARLVIKSNFVGPALLLGEAAERLSRAGGGTVVGVSSRSWRPGPSFKLCLWLVESRANRIPFPDCGNVLRAAPSTSLQ